LRWDRKQDRRGAWKDLFAGGDLRPPGACQAAEGFGLTEASAPGRHFAVMRATDVLLMAGLIARP